MKKTAFLTIIVAIFALFFTSCKKEEEFFLQKYVSDLRYDILTADYLDTTVTVFANRTEEDKINDGVVGKCVNYLLFKLPLSEPDKTFTVKTTLDGVDYLKDFTFDPISNCLTAKIYPPSFSLEKFSATISVGSESVDLSFTSILTDGCADYVDVLKALYKTQKTLIDSLFDGETFNAELSLKILINDDKPYWYVAIIPSKEKTKAMLFDAKSLDLLAVKDVF